MEKLILTAFLTVSLSTVGCNKVGGGSGARPALKTEDDKTLYALGMMVARNVASFNLTPAELEIVKAGLTDQLSGKKPEVELEVYGPKIGALQHARAGAKAESEKAKSKAYLDKAASEPGVEKTASGLIYKSLTEGTGASPVASDQVKVHYAGKLIDGTEFDSSIKRGEPAQFPLGGVIKCWTEGLQKMKVGGKAQLTCPSDIAYGDQGRPPRIPGGATLIFEVQLLEIVKK